MGWKLLKSMDHSRVDGLPYDEFYHVIPGAVVAMIRFPIPGNQNKFKSKNFFNMNRYSKLILTGIILLFFGMASTGVVCQTNNNFEIAKNLDIFATLFKELNKNYVDEISPGNLMETGIVSMLESLDPYTVYIPESEVEDYKFITTGQYGGVGALIQLQGKDIVVVEPYEGNPAQKAGIKAGDVILEVNGQNVQGKATDEVSAILKGQPGTTVQVLLRREGVPEPFEKNLEREYVKIDNIPYYGMIGDGIGYIRLMSFTQEAGKEVKDAFLELKANNELKGIVLDLRGNGGGLLQEAVSITNIFVEKGNMVVTTKGKLPNKNYTYTTTNAAVDKDIPLVVLVDNSSASASEIVAGAIQDLDRGVILGQRTYGKGLVQNVIPLTYNAQAKITVAKYYIPSGRCIQAIDYSKKNENGDSQKIPDSLITAYKTRNGRIVYDGLGIDPDVKTEKEDLTPLSTSLLTKFLFFKYATRYEQEHSTIPAANEFEVSDDIYNDFVAYLADKDYDYTTKCEETLEKLKQYAHDEKYDDALQPELDLLAVKLSENKDSDLAKHKEEIKKILKIEIVSRYYYQKGQIIASLGEDPDVAKAIEVLNEKDSYIAILDGTGKQSEIKK
jgi:carboxyl-terminal processing protease